MFTLINGKITCVGHAIPHERAGFVFFHKLNDKAKLIVLENTDGKLELATLGKCDFGFIKQVDDENEALAAKNKFIAKSELIGEEPLLAVASRKATLETGGLIQAWPMNAEPVEITTSPHTSWLSEDIEISTIISLYPYELSQEQFLALENKTFSSFKKAITIDITFEDDKVKLMLDDKNLFDDRKRWRHLDGLLLKDHADEMQNVFLKMLRTEKAASLRSSALLWHCGNDDRLTQKHEPAAPAPSPEPK